jgi:hypothetical protein
MIDFFSPWLWILILFIALLVLAAVLVSRKIKGGELPPMDRNQLVWNVEYLMRSRRWDTKPDYANGKIHVTKDSVIATNIYFKELPSGKIQVRSGASAGALGWALVILATFMAGIGAVVMAILLHFWSRGFAKKEVVPLIFGYHSSYGLNRRIDTIQDSRPAY